MRTAFSFLVASRKQRPKLLFKFVPSSCHDHDHYGYGYRYRYRYRYRYVSTTRSTKLKQPGTESSSNEQQVRDLLASLPPMKRILCICPVPTPYYGTNSNSMRSEDEELLDADYERYSIGLAISDPYLAYASPIPSEVDHDENDYHDDSHDNYICNPLPSWAYSSLYIPRGYGTNLHNICDDRSTNNSSTTATKTPLPVLWKDFPQTSQEFLSQIGYTDVGAIIFGLPMKLRELSLPTGYDSEDAKLRQVRRSIQCILKNFQSTSTTCTTTISNTTSSTTNRDEAVLTNINNNKKIMSPFDLQCLAEDHLTLVEAKKMAEEEPEMWEEIPLSLQNNRLANNPSIHAATSLNAFLWRHTGGWRNTFA